MVEEVTKGLHMRPKRALSPLTRRSLQVKTSALLMLYVLQLIQQVLSVLIFYLPLTFC